jgi:hypothetical protein
MKGSGTKEAALADRFRGLGPAAQACVPGVYAWAVTVAPLAFSRGAIVPAQLAAVFALVALFGAALLERRAATSKDAAPRSGTTFQGLSVWGFAGMSTIVLCLATPRALHSFDAARGVAGVVGWALYAFSSCAPAVRPKSDEARILRDPRLNARRGSVRDATVVGFGVVSAIVLQGFGWTNDENERAVLVRLVGLALSIAIVGATTAFVSGAERSPKLSRWTLVRGGLVWVVLFALLLVVAIARYFLSS